MSKKIYIVPVVHVVEFGLEIEIEAENIAQAKQLALDVTNGGNDGYDWSRCELKNARIGHWQSVKEREV